MTVEDRLRSAIAPDEAGARERALARLRAQYARPEPAAARRPLRARVAAVLVAAAVLVVAALSPPGDAVADWVRAKVGLRPQIQLPTDAAPRADRPPGGGRLLVAGAGSLWIVEPSGRRHRLGAWTAGSWSPHGLFVVAWKGRELAALDRRGRVQWALRAPRPVTDARWSPSGFRVAYRTGHDLRVVAGDGTGDRLLAHGARRALAWRPGGAHVLASTSGRHLDVRDADSGVRLARIQLPAMSRQIAWSADGTRLYARQRRSILVYRARGRRVGSIRMPGRATVTTFTPARRGHLLAVARRNHLVSEVALMGRRRDDVLFRADGRFTRLRFSPDGRWLLVAWPLPDQWVYLRPSATGTRRLLTARAVSRHFDVRGQPQLEGWCCPP